MRFGLIVHVRSRLSAVSAHPYGTRIFSPEKIKLMFLILLASANAATVVLKGTVILYKVSPGTTV